MLNDHIVKRSAFSDNLFTPMRHFSLFLLRKSNKYFEGLFNFIRISKILKQVTIPIYQIHNRIITYSR